MGLRVMEEYLTLQVELSPENSGKHVAGSQWTASVLH